MTSAHLAAIEAWARHRDDKQVRSVVLALCGELRRVQGYPPEPVPAPDTCSLAATVPVVVEGSESPYRGILHTMTAADVYGVEE